MGGRNLLSSDSQKHSRSFTSVLGSALLEWVLIVMLFVYGIFGYLIAKFARYCELPIPCLLCSRIDHILGGEKVGFYWDMICGNHKLEISSLVYCHFHEKLVDVHGMCESCLFSFATKDKSNSETYRLLVGKLGGEDLSGFDDNHVTGDRKTKSFDMKHCCCCNELWTSRCHAHSLLQTRSTGLDDVDIDSPFLSRDCSQDLTDMKKEVKSLHSLADFGGKSKDSLVQCEYTELKVTSDTELDNRISDAEDMKSLISNDPLRDLILDSTPMKPFTAVSEDEYAYEKPNSPTSVHIGHGLEELSWQEVDNKVYPSTSTDSTKSNTLLESPNDGIVLIDFPIDGELKVTSHTESDIQISDAEDIKALISNDPLRDLILDSTPMKPFNAASEDEFGPAVAPPSTTISHGSEELDWQEVDSKVDPSTSIDSTKSNVLLESANDGNVSISSPVEGANIEDATILSEKDDTEDSKDFDIKEAVVVQTLIPAADKTRESESLQIAADSNSLNIKPEPKDGVLSMPNQLELGDAYKLAISSRSRQFSGKLAEQLSGKESPRISPDLMLLLSQLSRGSEFPYNDILSPSPRPSRNLDEIKTGDSSTSIGMKFLQKKLSLERNDSKSSLDRNESGVESLDFSTVGEIEGETELDRLKRQHEHDKMFLITLLKELEEERNASAIAANETMAMITRLQEEKAALQMEASHDLRMMEEQAEYDIEALDKLNELLTEKEKEIQDLEAELEDYRNKYPNESASENLVDSAPIASISDPNDLNVFTGNLESNLHEPLFEIENEKNHILERLNSLETRLSVLCCNQRGIDSCEKPSEDGQEVKNRIDENGVISQKGGFTMIGSCHSLVRRMRSFERSKSAGAEQSALILKEADIICLASEVSILSKRLQALEADRSILENSINTLKNGEEKLIQEIASHLRALRKIGIRRYDQCNQQKR
ncbi:myosin-binding protein 1-like isoform X2 [Amaranthus tricolor]|uniref:myosin-binding protein 1-like isoform X2 n=1 Tax=Amaranthus tricolor TaxID=29722 RepID=UPI00258AD3E1|nr:myosin-binding protein 1-like isoform X2 [Amaranthus tricolor]